MRCGSSAVALCGWLWTLLVFPPTAVAYCPPCHGSIRMHSYNTLLQEQGAEEGAVISSGRPWGVSVPPAPNAPLTACGCGHTKATPRDDLRNMPKVEINKKVHAMEKEIAELSSTIEASEDEHKDQVEELQTRLETLTKKAESEQAELVKDGGDRVAAHKTVKDGVNDDQGKIEEINAKLNEIRDKNMKIREDLTIRMMDMRMCGCESASAALLLRHVSVFKHLDMPEGYDQILKFEKLESELGDLRKRQTAEQGEFGSKQRDLMHRIDLVKQKMNRQNVTAAKYKDIDAQGKEMVDWQADAMGKYLTVKQDQLKRKEEDYDSNQKLYKDLETEMGKCGCGPAAGAAAAGPAAAAAAFLDRKK